MAGTRLFEVSWVMQHGRTTRSEHPETVDHALAGQHMVTSNKHVGFTIIQVQHGQSIFKNPGEEVIRMVEHMVGIHGLPWP